MNNHKVAVTRWSQEQYDYALKQLWAELTDIPMNPETERMEAPFLHFPAGTEREDIWHWFDERYSKGVASLLYSRSGETVNCMSQTERTDNLNEMCPNCSRRACTYNCGGICYVTLVLGQNPQVAEGGKCPAYMRGDRT